jgi:hypothetical protein
MDQVIDNLKSAIGNDRSIARSANVHRQWGIGNVLIGNGESVMGNLRMDNR